MQRHPSGSLPGEPRDAFQPGLHPGVMPLSDLAPVTVPESAFVASIGPMPDVRPKQLPPHQMLPQTPAMEQLLQMLLADSNFTATVNAANAPSAAVAAFLFVKNNWRTVAQALKLPGLGGFSGGLPPGAVIEGNSPTHRRSSDGGWRGEPAREFKKNDRVIIMSSNKKNPVPPHLLGKEGTVMQLRPNGWLRVLVGVETLEIQQRYVQWAGPGGGRAGPKLKEVLRQVRKELQQMEEQVPWREVQDRWRTSRKGWTRRLRQAENVRDLAALIQEFHDHLKTDKSSGLFMEGGSWEVSLRDCATGHSNHLTLQALWEDMRAALQAWLAARSLPGGLLTLDRSTYQRAAATYQVLQEAAAKGPEYLEQVPLEQILAGQDEVYALQAIIHREQAAYQARLQAVATGGPGTTAAAAAAMAAGAAGPPGLVEGLPMLDGGFEGGLTEDLLASLDKLPPLKPEDGAMEEDVDTEQDQGPEATDLEESDFFDGC